MTFNEPRIIWGFSVFACPCKLPSLPSSLAADARFSAGQILIEPRSQKPLCPRKPKKEKRLQRKPCLKNPASKKERKHQKHPAYNILAPHVGGDDVRVSCVRICARNSKLSMWQLGSNFPRSFNYVRVIPVITDPCDEHARVVFRVVTDPNAEHARIVSHLAAAHPNDVRASLPPVLRLASHPSCGPRSGIRANGFWMLGFFDAGFSCCWSFLRQGFFDAGDF